MTLTTLKSGLRQQEVVLINLELESTCPTKMHSNLNFKKAMSRPNKIPLGAECVQKITSLKFLD